ncbi:MAG TPA: tol-pal system protein YbgF [Usitatibacter sp.]
MKAARLAAAAAFAILASLPARAGLFDDDEARRRIDQLRQELAQQGKDNEARIQKLENQLSHIGVVELVQQIEQLNEQIARLRGQIEVLANENQQLQKRQRDFYLDLDSRLKRLESPAAGTGTPGAPPPAGAPAAATSPAPPSSGTASGPPAVPGDSSDAKSPSREDQAREMKAYDEASNLFRRNDFTSAVEAFRAFLKDYPASPLVPNAHYWIGISYANLKDYPHALAAQQELLAKHPQSAKAPDALLAIAAIQAEQGQAAQARNTLEDLIARYPASDAAAKARTRLTALRR